MLFSQRNGLKQKKNVIQVNSMDDDLRNSLWNILTEYYWKAGKKDPSGVYITTIKDQTLNYIVKALWSHFFKKPMDTIPGVWNETYEAIREYFFSCKWFEVYDFIEFIIDWTPGRNCCRTIDTESFIYLTNIVLERELSAYRIIDDKFVQITSEGEVRKIENVLDGIVSWSPMGFHLDNAFKMISDRNTPNYRNSINESNSIVESMCKLFSDE